MPFKDDELKEILTIFKGETEEHLQRLNEGILALEKDPDQKKVIEEVFREAHNIKGAARMIGFDQVEKVAHSIEDIFNEIRKNKLALNSSLSDILLEGLDLINHLVNQRLAGKEKVEVDIEEYLSRQGEIAEGKEIPGVTDKEKAEKKAAPRKKSEAKPPPKKKAKVTEPDEEKAETEEISISLGIREEVEQSIKNAEERVMKEKKGEDRIRQQLDETIRVSVDKLDELIAQVGEILVTKIRSDQRIQEVREFLSDLLEFRREWHRITRMVFSRSHDGHDRALMAYRFIKENSGRLDGLAEQATQLASGMGDENLRLELISGNIQESINRIRMLPLSSIFNFFPRLVRDIAREQKKDINLIINGADTRLDKKIMEELKDPLTHLLRNSIDHGIEAPDEREALGKPREGRLSVTAYQKGNNVLVELEDDGCGIDLEKVKETALKKGFISEEALRNITYDQLIQIIFQPGFSTKSIITDVSGRGVGLDVVLTNIEKLKGTISTNSIRGKGTKFSIKLPLTLATAQALLISSAGESFAIPLTAVEYTGEVGLEEISTVEGRETVLIGGQPTSLVKLSEVLKLKEGKRDAMADRISIVVISSADDRFAFAVDELVGEGEIVLKNLGSHLRRVPNIAGATLLADGTPVMILNFFDLIKSARMVKGMWVAEKIKFQEQQKKKYTVMVVDDSITTRNLEKSILESNGYKVITAIDGVEAMEKLKTKGIDLIVSDIQMPRMDGFKLTSKIKKDEKLRELPVVLVTSLESKEDKEKGIRAGADAYITKGAFDQGNLLSTIKQLL